MSETYQTNNQNHNDNKIPNNITFLTFYVTAFLLNYDVSNKLLGNTKTNDYDFDPNSNSNYMKNFDIVKLDQNNENENNLKIMKRLLKLILEDKKYNMEIKLNKFFEYVLCKKINVPDVVIILCKKLNLDQDNEENLLQSENHIMSYLDIINERKIIFKEYNHDEIYKKINKLLSIGIIKLKKDNDIIHSGQPLPDPINGRPQLNWGFCQYDKCKKSFSDCSSLIEHLVKNNAYTQGYHSSHEEGVRYNLLDESKVIKNNISKCPSWMCEIKNFASPEELIQHLQLLGIKPFWKQGMSFCIESSQKKILSIEPNKKYISENCVLCLENKPEIIINRCGHQIYCIDCIAKSNKINCPICRGKVDMFLPYA